jgi:hypothetical protein
MIPQNGQKYKECLLFNSGIREKPVFSKETGFFVPKQDKEQRLGPSGT